MSTTDLASVTSMDFYDLAPLSELIRDLPSRLIVPNEWGGAAVNRKVAAKALAAPHASQKDMVSSALAVAKDCLARGIAVGLGLRVVNLSEFDNLSKAQKLAFQLMVCGSLPELL